MRWDGSEEGARGIIAYMLATSGGSCAARRIEEVTKEQAAERKKAAGAPVQPEPTYMLLDQVGKETIRVEVGDNIVQTEDGFFDVA
jgi:hypothetical protein